MKTISDVKFVVFDISAEYGVNIIDLLKEIPSRIILTEPLPNYHNNGNQSENMRIEQ